MADKAYFLSDIHLGSATEPNAFLLLRFLRAFTSREQITHLFLVGDIFDLWVSSHLYFKRKFAPIVSELVRLKGLGIQVHYFEGNHDLYLKDYFGRELGFSVHEGAKYFDLAGKRVRVEHGDQMDPEDTGYLFLRKFLRTRFMKWLAPRLPEKWIAFCGEKFSQLSRMKSRHAERRADADSRIKNFIREHTARAYHKAPFDILVAGHVHMIYDDEVRIIKAHSHKSARVVNLGSWYQSPPQVFLMSPGAAEFEKLE